MKNKKIKEIVSEVAPKGWEKTVKAMKKSREIDNPWALANWMKSKGMKSHKNEAAEESIPMHPKYKCPHCEWEEHCPDDKTAFTRHQHYGANVNGCSYTGKLINTEKNLKQEAAGADPNIKRPAKCSKCNNPALVVTSIEPLMLKCDKCGWNWKQGQNVNEEHGDVHYWGAQPQGAEQSISTGYKGTPKMNESSKIKNFIKETVRELVKEHDAQREQQEAALFKMIKDRVEQLLQMHQTMNYDEGKELELIRQIKKIALQAESLHTGTKITANEQSH